MPKTLTSPVAAMKVINNGLQKLMKQWFCEFDELYMDYGVYLYTMDDEIEWTRLHERPQYWNWKMERN